MIRIFSCTSAKVFPMLEQEWEDLKNLQSDFLMNGNHRK